MSRNWNINWRSPRCEAAQTRINAKTGTYHELADAQVQVNERYLPIRMPISNISGPA